MKSILLFLLLVGGILYSSTGAAEALHREVQTGAFIDPIDRQVADTLRLSEKQLVRYSRIMQEQRPTYLAIPAGEWQSKKRVYEETVQQLSEVLSARQLQQFAALMGCLLEEGDARVIEAQAVSGY